MKDLKRLKTNDSGMFPAPLAFTFCVKLRAGFFEPSIPLSLHVLHELHGEFALFSGLNCGI
jgi:hypothetical protein